MGIIQNILIFFLIFSFSSPTFSSISDENRIYKNNKFGFKFRLSDNLCIAKSSDSQVYLFDKETLGNKTNKNWGKPDLINGRNIHGVASVLENSEFVDITLDEYLENLPGKFNNWTRNEEYIIWTLVFASKVEINNHEYIKELYSLNLNKTGKERSQHIKDIISDRFGIEPIMPNDIINIIMIKGYKDKFQYKFSLSFRDELVNEESIEKIIKSFELVPIQNEEVSTSNINCQTD